MLIFTIEFTFVALAFGFSLACGAQTTPDFPSNSREPLAHHTQVPTPEPSPDTSLVRKKCEGLIWSGTIGGKSVEWTSDDVFLVTGGRRQALFRPSAVVMHRAGVETTQSNLKYISGHRGIKNSPLVKTLVGIEMISVVDPIVTFEIETLSFLEGNPGLHSTWWLSLDLSKATKIAPFSALDVQNFHVSGMADLRTMFAKDDLYRAIIENPEVRKVLEGNEGSANIGILKKWMDRTADLSKLEERIPIGQQGLSLVEYSFHHFVFDRIQNDRIVVRLALVNLAASDTYRNDYIEIFLPVEGTFETQIHSASRGKNGFLANDRGNTLPDCNSTIELNTPIVQGIRKRT